jgi:MFS family permease
MILSFSATVPTVIQGLGYSSANAQLLTIPLYVFAVILVLLFSWLSDKYQVRWVFIVLGFSIAIVGYVAQLAIPHPKYPGLTYGFLFPLAGGMYSSFPPVLSWAGMNNRPNCLLKLT